MKGTMNRHEANPIITRMMVPDTPPHLEDVSSVFNPGAVRFEDRILLMLRVQNRGRETFFLIAESSDGMRFAVRPEHVRIEGIEEVGETVYHCYDARITPLEGAYYIMFAMDMDERTELGLARTDDFESFRFMGVVSKGGTRNGVLFPEKVGGRYLRLDRPNRIRLPSGVATGDAIVLSESDDLLNWRPVADVATGRRHYWDELIGAGPPPIKTREGWLLIYHGVATHFDAGVYQMGVMLLDLDDPGKVTARSRCNILEPRELYEMVGQVPNVVFPGGATVQKIDDDGFALTESRVLVYYGAADTCVCLALTTIEDLIAAARKS